MIKPYSKEDLKDLFIIAKNEYLCFSQIKSKSIYFAYVINNLPIAFVEVLIFPKNKARIRNVYTMPKFRNQGIGTALVEYVLIKEYKKLDVYTYYPGFYSKYGFSIKRSYYLKNGPKVFYMVKQ